PATSTTCPRLPRRLTSTTSGGTITKATPVSIRPAWCRSDRSSTSRCRRLSALARARSIAVRMEPQRGPLPLPLGEGWGEGLRSLVQQRPLTRIAAQFDLSPPGRGEESRARQFNQGSSCTRCATMRAASLFLLRSHVSDVTPHVSRGLGVSLAQGFLH